MAQDHNPNTDWRTGKFELQSEFCRQRCFSSNHVSSLHTSLLGSVSEESDFLDISKVPSYYHNLKQVEGHLATYSLTI